MAQCSLRFTFGEENTIEDVEELVKILEEVCQLITSILR